MLYSIVFVLYIIVSYCIVLHCIALFHIVLLDLLNDIAATVIGGVFYFEFLTINLYSIVMYDFFKYHNN